MLSLLARNAGLSKTKYGMLMIVSKMGHLAISCVFRNWHNCMQKNENKKKHCFLYFKRFHSLGPFRWDGVIISTFLSEQWPRNPAGNWRPVSPVWAGTVRGLCLLD